MILIQQLIGLSDRHILTINQAHDLPSDTWITFLDSSNLFDIPLAPQHQDKPHHDIYRFFIHRTLLKRLRQTQSSLRPAAYNQLTKVLLCPTWPYSHNTAPTYLASPQQPCNHLLKPLHYFAEVELNHQKPHDVLLEDDSVLDFLRVHRRDNGTQAWCLPMPSQYH